MKKIHNIRTNYNLQELRRKDLEKSPISQFLKWFNELEHESDFNAVTLSTYSKEDGIQNRVVLLKDVNTKGFVFYTNYDSLKSKQIESNNHVALCFFWPKFQRQVRVNGVAKKISDKTSNNYFTQRPRRSQISTWVSQQSNVVVSRKYLEHKFEEAEKKFQDKNVVKPDNWGGYQVLPLSIEFWQGREDRMHDRFIYKKKNQKWVVNRLFP